MHFVFHFLAASADPKAWFRSIHGFSQIRSVLLVKTKQGISSGLSKLKSSTRDSEWRSDPKLLLSDMSVQCVSKTKYGHTYSTFRGHKSKHCRACNKCIEKFDHHCIWLRVPDVFINYDTVLLHSVEMHFHTK